MSGIKLFGNVPEKFLPPKEDWPDFVYADPDINWIYYQDHVVKEVAVVGVPDLVRTQAVKAFIVLNQEFNPSDDLVKELQAFAKDNMSFYKYPRIIEFIDSLPKDHLGKIQRRILRERSS